MNFFAHTVLQSNSHTLHTTCSFFRQVHGSVTHVLLAAVIQFGLSVITWTSRLFALCHPYSRGSKLKPIWSLCVLINFRQTCWECDCKYAGFSGGGILLYQFSSRQYWMHPYWMQSRQISWGPKSFFLGKKHTQKLILWYLICDIIVITQKQRLKTHVHGIVLMNTFNEIRRFKTLNN